MKGLQIISLMASCVLLFSCSHLAFVSQMDGRYQICKMTSAGENQTRLSASRFNDHGPDVSADGEQIVFSSVREGAENIYIMDADGSNIRQVTSGSLQRVRPRWSKALSGEIIAFAYPAYRGNTKIWTIKPDGTGLLQVTSPGPAESDDGGHDFYHRGKMLVFSRLDSSTQDRDLYTTYFDGSQGITRITTTADVSETQPVVSHDGRSVAYRATYSNPSRDVVRLVSLPGFTLVREVALQPPASGNIQGLSFSDDDERLYVAIEADDVPGSSVLDRLEIFSIKTDGTDQRRLTRNRVQDSAPCAFPRRGRAPG